MCIYKNERDEIRLECKRYHRPKETSIGRRPYHGKTEIFDSNHFEIYDAYQVKIEKCTIESQSEYRKRTEYPNNVFYQTEFYDFSIEKVVSSVLPNKDNVSLRRKILDRERKTQWTLRDESKISEIQKLTSKDQKREQNEVREEGIQNIQIEKKKEEEGSEDLFGSFSIEMSEGECEKVNELARVEYDVDELPAMNESEDVNKHEKENEKENESENEKNE